MKEEPEPLLSPVKEEPKAEPPPSPAADPSSASHHSSPEVDPLPGTASLMSSPRGRGRPRKIKPEVELHLRTVKNRRRRRSSRAGSDDQEGGAVERGMQDLTQSAFLSWLSQTQGSLSDPGAGPEVQPADSVKEMAERQGQWFNLLPKTPCDSSSLSKDPLPSPEMPPSLTAPLLQVCLVNVWPEQSLLRKTVRRLCVKLGEIDDYSFWVISPLVTISVGPPAARPATLQSGPLRSGQLKPGSETRQAAPAGQWLPGNGLYLASQTPWPPTLQGSPGD